MRVEAFRRLDAFHSLEKSHWLMIPDSVKCVDETHVVAKCPTGRWCENGPENVNDGL